MSPSAVHALQRLLRLFRAKPSGVRDHHFGQPDDGIERRAQLVAHAGDELRLVLARPFELAALVLDFVEQPHVLDRVPSRSIGTPRTVRTLANPDPTVSLISASALVSTT